MSKILKAKEFLKEKDDYENLSVYTDETVIIMIKFAKLHVKAALKAASKVELDDVELMPKANDFKEARELSILNAYPLENIK